jgi:hypothetical protein
MSSISFAIEGPTCLGVALFGLAGTEALGVGLVGAERALCGVGVVVVLDLAVRGSCLRPVGVGEGVAGVVVVLALGARGRSWRLWGMPEGGLMVTGM